ncbi:MAG: TIGR00730 family Rossman fold protein [Ruoffia tabacinasalis]|uniref:LOG family protein n=1 Tax=Ruoffia sp. FAM 26254 TaxID=3259518 RepID=UPI0038888A07
MGQQGHPLVYGGSMNGLMGFVADTVLEENGDVQGIIPEVLRGIEANHPNVQNMEIVQTMPERKTRMIELRDAFIALPSGVGTLEEISEIVSLTRIGLINKPTVFYNDDGYYEALKEQFGHMVQEEFLKLEVRETFLFSESLQEIETFIREHS